MYTYYNSCGSLIIGSDFNASFVHKNVEFTNPIKSKELTSFVYRDSLQHLLSDMYIDKSKGSYFSFTVIQTMLDYIFMSNELLGQLRSYEILEEGSFSSTTDHSPVLATLELQEIRHIPAKPPSKLSSRHKITETDVQNYQKKTFMTNLIICC